MRLKKVLCIILAALNLVCVSLICVLAAPEGEQVSDIPLVTEPVSSQSVDVSTGEPVSLPTTIGGEVNPSSSFSGTYPTEPTSVSSTEQTVPTETTVVPSTPRPTEYQENPSIDFEIQTPVLVKPDDNKDNSAKDWEDIDESELIKDADKDNLSVKDDGGLGGFGFDKGSVSRQDEHNPLFMIIAIVCWFIALGLLTLAILLPSSKKNNVASSSKNRKINRR